MYCPVLLGIGVERVGQPHSGLASTQVTTGYSSVPVNAALHGYFNNIGLNSTSFIFGKLADHLSELAQPLHKQYAFGWLIFFFTKITGNAVMLKYQSMEIGEGA